MQIFNVRLQFHTRAPRKFATRFRINLRLSSLNVGY
jgi:hypothetical protein